MKLHSCGLRIRESLASRSRRSCRVLVHHHLHTAVELRAHSLTAPGRRLFAPGIPFCECPFTGEKCPSFYCSAMLWYLLLPEDSIHCWKWPTPKRKRGWAAECHAGVAKR